MAADVYAVGATIQSGAVLRLASLLLARHISQTRKLLRSARFYHLSQSQQRLKRLSSNQASWIPQRDPLPLLYVLCLPSDSRCYRSDNARHQKPNPGTI